MKHRWLLRSIRCCSSLLPCPGWAYHTGWDDPGSKGAPNPCATYHKNTQNLRCRDCMVTYTLGSSGQCLHSRELWALPYSYSCDQHCSGSREVLLSSAHPVFSKPKTLFMDAMKVCGLCLLWLWRWPLEWGGFELEKAYEGKDRLICQTLPSRYHEYKRFTWNQVSFPTDAGYPYYCFSVFQIMVLEVSYGG